MDKEEQSKHQKHHFNHFMELVPKLLQVSLLLSIILGAVVIAVYLDKINLSQELTSLLGAQSVLIVVSIYAMSASLLIISLLGFVPETMRTIIKAHLKPLKLDKKWIVFWGTVLIFVPLLAFLSVSIFPKPYKTLGMLGVQVLVLFVSGAIIGLFPLKELNKDWKIWLAIYSLLAFVFSMLLAPLLIFTLFINGIELFKENQIEIFLIVTFTYSLVCGISLVLDEKLKLIPLLSFGLLGFVYVFASNFILNVAEKTGVGHFNVSFLLEKKYLSTLPSDGFVLLKTQNNDICILHNAWLLARTSNKVIIASSSDEKALRYTFSTSAIIGELDKAREFDLEHKCF